MDPKIIAGIATPILAAIGLFVWNRGKRAGVAAAKQALAQLHQEQVKAQKTPGTADDDAVAAKIAMAEAALAALEAL